jgi:hypothetical protein
MYEYQIGLEREELGEYPEEEAKELARSRRWWHALGTAKRLADSSAVTPSGPPLLARAETGLNPDEWLAALGHRHVRFFRNRQPIPPLPFLFGKSTSSLYVAIGLTAAALFGVGAALSLFTGRGALRGGLRMLLIGSGAGTLTFLIGRLLGVSLG